MKCQLDFIYEQPSEQDIREALDSLPATMTATYDRIMKVINDQNDATKKLAHRALAWIITAKRPLTIEELLFAVSLKPPERPYYDDGYERYSESAVLSSCRGLVTNACGTIRPIHFTVQEFLRSRGLEPSKGVNASIFVTQSILVYLRSVTIKESKSYLSGIDVHIGCPVSRDLLKYSCGFLGHHLRETGNPLPKCILVLVKLLMQGRYGILRWVILKICGDPGLVTIGEHLTLGRGGGVVVVHAQAGCGLVLSPLGLLSGLDLLPLYFQLYSTVVRKEELMEVFHDVVRGGSVSAVKALLDRGCDIESRDSVGETPLMAAAASGCEPMVIFLAREGEGAHSLPRGVYSVLHDACGRGMARAVRALLERGADPNSPRADGVLGAAIGSGNAAVVKLLLDHGAHLRGVEVRGGTALGAAVRYGSPAVVKVLMDAGSRVNQTVWHQTEWGQHNI